MTVSQRQNIDKWVRYANLLGIVILIFSIGAWKSDAENRMFDDAAQKARTISHSEASDTHMPLIKKEEHFVTRREYESTMIYIKEALERLEDKKN